MTQGPARQQTISPLAWALLGLLALIWGGSFLSNRAAVGSVPVLTIVAFRVTGAAVALWLYVYARGLPVPRGPRPVMQFTIMGILNNVLPFSLIVWGQGHIASGLAGILNAATAIFTVLLVALIFLMNASHPARPSELPLALQVSPRPSGLTSCTASI